ncbi:MAG: glycosyltransferase WbuB, partial [Bacteroidales bacterium]|nr:glycosyltransferase WbuB [Bacteroidales bacterium]
MKIIFLTFYFEPDLCAGSFRNTPLAKEIAKQIDSKSEVHVITTHPNRYYSFKTEALSYENSGSLHIHRIKIPTHKSGLIDQAKSFTKFFFAALKITRNIEYDLVYASSSRLFTAFLGRVISIQKKAPLYLDIRDIFVDTINNIFQHKIIRVFLLTFLRVVENFTFSNAKHLNLISEGFIPYFKKYTRPYYSYFPNGIDPIFTSIKIHNPQKSNFKIITYAGNIGEGQGLHKIIPDLAKKLKNNYRF